MEKSWFAGNFCPVSEKCSIEDGLKPKEGPEIRSMVGAEQHPVPYLAEIRQFEGPPQPGAVQWMPAHGQRISLSEYIELYPIIGYLYGSTASREVFPLPDLSEYPGVFFICVKGGRTPQRP